MQRRRTTVANASGNKKPLPSPRHGRVGAFTRNMNSKTMSKKKSTFIFTLLLLFFFGLLYLEKSMHHSNTKIAHKSEGLMDNGKIEAKIEKVSLDSATKASAKAEIEKIKQEFYKRYGGKEEAIAMLNRGIISAGSSSEEENNALRHTAERIILSLSKEKKFVMSFGGYSVTVGRGNYYKQSYPFIMEKVLKPVFESLSLELVVRNSAIGGIPSMPYGWCLKNFLGDDSDVVSWDYGMNEGNGAGPFESYIRQSIATLSKRPMMILLDNKKTRVNMMKEYHKNGALLDSIAVGRGEVVQKKFLEMEEKDRPIGFQRWDEWGAPKGSPGQSKWHPKMMEHEMIGWMIAMHFLDAIENAIDMVDRDDFNISQKDHEKMDVLPTPVSSVDTGSPSTPTHILYGTQIDDLPSSLWKMDAVSCRTSFLPNIHGGLNEIILSGQAEDVGDDLKSRDDSLYNSGWVIDVGKVERDTKRKVEKVGGLGYIDMKNALYGIPESGNLSLSLPHEGPIHDHSHDEESDKMLATHWFDTLVICEVNEKRGKKECTPEKDMEFIVGGVKSDSVVQITNAASYLKKSICINVGIPSDAIATMKDLGSDGEDKVELSVDISVSRKSVNRADGACSISHVVWQSH